MTTTAPQRDTKAGACVQCRKGEHGMCIAPRCTCTQRRHENRPQVAQNVPTSRPAPASAEPEPDTTEPVDVTWEDPPPRTRGDARPLATPEVLAALRANPKRWAKVGAYLGKTIANGMQNRFKKGQFGPVAPPEWECAARRVGSSGSALYLRYVGPAE